MQKHQDNLTKQHASGAPLVAAQGVTVSVIDQATGLPPLLYSDNGTTLIVAAIVTDALGYYAFYAADGRYTLTYTGAGIVTFTREIILDDSNEGGLDARDFGAVCDGVTDDTSAIERLIAYCKASGRRAELTGNIAAKWVRVTDAVYNFNLHGNNVTLFAIDNAAHEGFLEITNCVDFRVTGVWHIYGQDATNYDSMVRIKAIAGTSQATTRVSLENITVRRAGLGKAPFWIGTENNDYQCSEITINNCHAFQCDSFVRGEGSQSGATFVGCTLVAEQNPAFGIRPLRTCFFKGGFWYIVGGELVQTSATPGDVAIECRPANSPTFHNPYPIVKVSNCHIESSGLLLYVNNLDGRATPRSDSSSIAFSNCGGYMSSNGPGVIDTVGDSSYAGKIVFNDGCAFYGDFGINRAATHIALGANTRIDLDGNPFGQSFFQGLSGLHPLYPGKPRLRGETILARYGAVTSIASAVATVVDFPSSSNTVDSAYGNSMYAAGVWTTTQDMKDVVVEYQIAFAVACPLADSYITINGANSGSFGTTTQTIKAGRLTIPFLAAGSTVSIVATTNSGAAVALTGGTANYLRIAPRTL